jgi:hypothetical protein
LGNFFPPPPPPLRVDVSIVMNHGIQILKVPFRGTQR